MDDHNAFDLANLGAGFNRPIPAFGDGPTERRIDASGKPLPEDVRVQLNSGIEVKCDIRYDGIDTTDNTRRFLVICEMDWENYFPKTLIVGLYPSDVTLCLRVPGASDDDHVRFSQSMRVVTEKILAVS